MGVTASAVVVSRDPPPAVSRLLSNPPPGYDGLEELGHGGMGYVCKAVEIDSERTVAIKFLRDRFSIQANARFRREVQALAKVKHPNVVPILSVDLGHDDPYYTMEYEANGSLASVIKDKGRLPAAEAAAVAEQLARGLDAIHKADVLHRDLKPHNVLIADDGTPKIADLGLAKQLDKVDEPTQTGALLGTVQYMAPEQAGKKNKELDVRTDVYGLGSILYHALTGQAPFSGRTNVDVQRKVLSEFPTPPRAVHADIPKDLEAVCLKCLEKEPSRRYASAADLADDLGRVRAGKGTVARPLGPAQRLARAAWNAKKWVAATALVFIGTGLGLLAFMAPPVKEQTRPTDDASRTPEERMTAAGERVRARLLEGPVTLVGATGVPEYRRFHLESNAIDDSAGVDRIASFHAFSNCLLELCPPPGVQRYWASFELRQDKALPQANVQPVDTDFLGIYFGHGQAEVQGVRVHSLFAIGFKETDLLNKNNEKLLPASFRKLGYFQTPGKPIPPVQIKTGWKTVRYTPYTRPGEFRTIRIDVSPEKVFVTFPDDTAKPQPLCDWDGDTVRSEYERLKNQMDESVPGAKAALPGWTPDMPFGIIAFKSSVSVRNVVITPY